ncbi:MAG: hypothetical protein KF764_22595 [Labilithrix sp.]|nr:hypothetical protein [Labilithrix sp.]MBX3223599.1 hypothetical protein [Labilithrix sp.]
MRTLRTPVAIVASVVTLFCASASSADETSEAAPAPSPPTPSTQQPQAVQPVQPQVAQPQVVQPQIVQPAQPQVGTTQTTAAPYIPPGGDRYAERTVERRPNRALLSTGTGLFVLSYGSSVVAGALSDRDADKRLFIPVVGPWMDLSRRGCGAENPCGANEDVAKAMIVTSGVVQGASVLMALGSLLIPESTTVTERSRSAQATKPGVTVMPVSFAAGAGIGAVGRF